MNRDQLFFERFGKTSDEAWLELLIRSIDQPVIDGVEFPRFPSEKTQSGFVGSSGAEAMREAFVFYQDVRRYAGQLGLPVSRESRVLDFGCGWGRHYRIFLRELMPARYVGIDIDPECVAICRQTIPTGNFEQSAVEPPLRFADGSFDIVYAYSVFSHLSETVHLRGVEEFARILRPGGMLVVTTLKRAHIGVWDRLMREGPPWWKAFLRKVEFDCERWQAGYDAGQFLFCPTGGGGVRSAEFYGEAIISPAYIRKFWSRHLDLVEHLDDRANAPQVLIVAQKRTAP